VRVVRVDAMRIAQEEKSRPNAVLLGTLCGLIPFLDSDKVLEFLSSEFAQKYPAAVESNARAYRRGAAEMELVACDGITAGNVPAGRFEPLWGYETAPLGGVLPLPGNSIWNDLSNARMGWLPVFDSTRCIHCALCDMVCPDFCFVWHADRETGVPEKTQLMGIDYRYCKGCMRCIESCPTGALTNEVESAAIADERRVPLFPDLIP